MKIPSLSEIQPNQLSDNSQRSSAVDVSMASATAAGGASCKTMPVGRVSVANTSTSTSSKDNSEKLSQNTNKISSERFSDELVDVVDIYLQQAAAYCDELQWDKATAACKEAMGVVPENASAYKLMGNILQKQGKLTDAMGFYAKALALQPGSPEIYSNLGTLYARKQDWASAIAYLQKAIDKDPQFAVAHSNLAKVWKKLGKSDQELACLQTALQLQPEIGSARSHYRIAQSLEGQAQAEAAIVFYRQAIERSPNFLPAYQRLVDLLEDQGDWQSAVTYYRKVVELTAKSSANSEPYNRQNNSQTSEVFDETVSEKAGHPINRSPSQRGNAKFRLSKSDQQLVQNLLQASSKKQLLRPINRAEDRIDRRRLNTPQSQSFNQPESKLASLSKAAQLGAHYANAKDWPRATHYFKQALQDNPQSAKLYRTIATLLARNGQPQQAAMAWYRAFTLEPSWPDAAHYLQVGKALFAQGKIEAAAHCYRHAIRLQPKLSAAYQQLARLLESQGHPDMAEAVLQRLKSARPSPQQGRLTKTDLLPRSALLANATNRTAAKGAQALRLHKQGENLQKQEKWGGAIAAYQKAIEFNPTFSWSYHNLGDCYKRIGNWNAATEAYQKATELKPDFIWSYYSLAEAAEAQQNWLVAARYYRHALRIDAENAQVPSRLSDVLQQLIEAHPRNTDYYKELAELQIVQGRKDKAIATYQMALQIRPDEPTVALALSKLIAKQDPQQAHALIDRALSGTVTNRDIQSPQDLQDIETVAALLLATHLFDPKYYRATNPELTIEDDRELLLHYLRWGSTQGRNPNPLFDEQFYRDRHPELGNTNSLAHFHRFGYLAGDDPHPLFKTAFYCNTHKDVAAANINPLEHYLAYGAKEGRTAFSFEQLSPIIEQPTPGEADYLAPWFAAKTPVSKTTAPQQLAIYCNSLGNYFITEIADFITAALRSAGHTVLQLSEQDTPPEHFDGHWVVAPHEFFYLGDGPQWAQRQEWLSQAVLINVEQPQTTWFSKAFHFLRHAKVIFDINVKSTAILRLLKLPAYWLPLGYLPQYAEATASEQLPDLRALKSLSDNVSKQLPPIDAPLSDRPIDLHFIGTLNPRREQFFANSAQWLSRLYSFLHIPPMSTPLLKGQGQALDTSAVVGLSRRSKILLNIHRDDLPYFEWHRMVFHGLWQNTLVVTEPCHDIPGLVAGEHFVEASISEMPGKIDWLLNNPHGQDAAERIRSAGHRAIQEQFKGVAIAEGALQIARQRLQSSQDSVAVEGGQ